MNRLFMVVSDDYEIYHPNGIDPPENGRDVWEGEAANRAEARAIAMKEWLSEKYRDSCAKENRADGKHPMAGAYVIEWLPCEAHKDVQCEVCVYAEETVGKRSLRVLRASKALQERTSLAPEDATV